jgi:hypothetical protein
MCSETSWNWYYSSSRLQIFMWSKAYLLALRTIGYNCAAGLIITILEVVFNTRIAHLELLAQVWSAFITGGLYSQYQGITMSRDLKLWTSICYALISILAAPITIVLFSIHTPRFSSVWNTVGYIAIFGFIFVYWGLSFGSHTYMKRIKN